MDMLFLKKEKIVKFLSCRQKDYDLKSQVLCEFTKNNFQSRRNSASLLVKLPEKGGLLMKKDNKKEREIYTVGRPSLEKLSKNELKVFYSTLLSCFVEYYRKKQQENGASEQKEEK